MQRHNALTCWHTHAERRTVTEKTLWLNISSFFICFHTTCYLEIVLLIHADSDTHTRLPHGEETILHALTHTHTQCMVMLMAVTGQGADEEDLRRQALEGRICCPPSSHLPVFSHVSSSSLFLSLSGPPSTFPFFLLSRYFSAAGPTPLSPSLFPPSRAIKHGRKLTMPPSSHLQNTNKPSLLHLSSNKEHAFSPPALPPSLSVLSSFSLTISCGGLRTHQLSWV